MVTVVIPALNEEKRLPSCLEALTRQDFSEPFEVVVVDNNSKDQTREIAESFRPRLDIRVVHEMIRKRGAARKTGFAEAKGTIILSTDADTEVPPHWISTYVTALERDPKAAGMVGWTDVKDCTPVINVLSTTVLSIGPHIYRLFHGHYSFAGNTFAVRRSAYEQVGGFDATLDAQEDVELSGRIAKIGRIGYLAKLRVLSSGRRFKKNFLRGWAEYLSTYVRQFWFKEKEVTLSNPE